jgi:hypothetical protein
MSTETQKLECSIQQKLDVLEDANYVNLNMMQTVVEQEMESEESVKIEKSGVEVDLGMKRKRKDDLLPFDYLKEVAPAKDKEGIRIERERWIEGRESAARSEGFFELEYEEGTDKFEQAKKQLEEGMKAGTFTRLTKQFQQMKR